MDTPCIEWTGYRNRKGYGTKNIDYRPRLVHRLAWAEKHGPIPPGMFVLHNCDNPSCYNVEHLRLGTAADNTADMMARGRNRWGNNAGDGNPNAKLTEEKVRAIRKDQRTLKVLAAEYGVSISTLQSAKVGRTWKQVAS